MQLGRGSGRIANCGERSLQVVTQPASTHAKLYAMAVAMDGDQVPASSDLARYVRVPLHLFADEEERCASARSVERVQHRRGPERMWAVVERERDPVGVNTPGEPG